MPEDRTAENVPEALSGSGLSDRTRGRNGAPAWEYAPGAKSSAEDCKLNDPKVCGGDMDERLPGDDKTVDRP